MSKQISFLYKNLIDLDNKDDFSINVIDSTLGVDLNTESLLNLSDRRNDTSYGTIGSSDSGLTTIVITFLGSKLIDYIAILGHNFKDFTIKYNSGNDFNLINSNNELSGLGISKSLSINLWAVSTIYNYDDIVFHENAFYQCILTHKSGSDFDIDNLKNYWILLKQRDSDHFYFYQALVDTVEIKINSCFQVDTDKILNQIYIGKKLGQFMGWPEIKGPDFNKIKKVKKSLSGKSIISQRVGGVMIDLSIKALKDKSDLRLIKRLYEHPEGFHIIASSGEEGQFWDLIPGFRNEDIYLVNPQDDLDISLLKGVYTAPINYKMKLIEVTS